MIKIGKIPKKEHDEAGGVTCLACEKVRTPAVYFIQAGNSGNGQTLDFCTKHWIELSSKIAARMKR